MYKRTPIRIHDGKVYAFIRKGKESKDKMPVFRLGVPTQIKGLVLSYPYVCEHITCGSLEDSHAR